MGITRRGLKNWTTSVDVSQNKMTVVGMVGFSELNAASGDRNDAVGLRVGRQAKRYSISISPVGMESLNVFYCSRDEVSDCLPLPKVSGEERAQEQGSGSRLVGSVSSLQMT